MILSSLTFAVTIASVLSLTDWCSPDLCSIYPGNPQHIMCNHNGRFSTACGGSPEIIEMTAARKQSILDMHNSFRNRIATGEETKLPQAVRMQTLKWDNDLALGAEYNVKQCDMIHDECHNTNKFKWSGQNMANYFTSGTLNVDDDIVSSIESWYSEIKNTTVAHIKSYPNVKPKGIIGHFTAMMQDKSGYIGCAVSTYTTISDGMFNFLIACNYAYDNVKGTPVYAIGPTGSECTTGLNVKYPGLCNDKEVVDPVPIAVPY